MFIEFLTLTLGKSKPFSGADMVQKCEDFIKIIFFRNFTQYSNPGRFALHIKVNFHGKTQRLIYSLEDCNLSFKSNLNEPCSFELRLPLKGFTTLENVVANKPNTISKFRCAKSSV